MLFVVHDYMAQLDRRSNEHKKSVLVKVALQRDGKEKSTYSTYIYSFIVSYYSIDNISFYRFG